ncbi:unnamed protein product [Cochlearia groenlandica]
MKTKTYNFQFIVASVLTLFINGSSAASPPNSNSSSSCNRTCGGISIPFPFGMGGKDCYLNNWYEVVCNSTSGSDKKALFLARINSEVVNISIPDTIDPYGLVQIKGPVTSLGCSSNSSQLKSLPSLNFTGKGSPYFLTDENRLLGVGCGTKFLMTGSESEILGCESNCEESNSSEEVTNSICSGYKCCQSRMPVNYPQAISVNIEINNSAEGEGCKVAFLTNKRYSPSNVTQPEQFHSEGYAVVELGWYFDTSNSRFRNPLGCINLTHSSGSSLVGDKCLCDYGYFSGINYRNCYCGYGFTGNPYIQGGCIATTPPPSPSCVRTCGGVSIPFPFGIGEKECYLNSWYEVVCNTTTSGSSVTTTTTVPYLSRINKEVVNISLPDYNAPYSVSYHYYGLVHIKGPVTSLSCSTSQVSESSSTVLNVTGDFFGMSYSNCYCNSGYIGNPYVQPGCTDDDSCKGRPNICREDEDCVNMPGLMYECAPKPKIDDPVKPPVFQEDSYFIVYIYVVGVGILIGLLGLVFVFGTFGMYKLVKKRRRIIRNKKFFKRNGGLLLQQHLTTKDGNVEMSRIFTSKELKKATDNFSANRVLGQGGQGTVYKGMLEDGRIVAVKRSKLVDKNKLEEFINEVVLLSHINHRNIVKLLGCCLETEVPVLVYEYIPNGDLFKRLHNESDDYTMTWEVRLRIAIEIAGALSYMHSAASFPIYHRDVKTTNILLDEKYRGKVSDFGTSRSVTIDQTHLTTQVAGTFGYMDPECLNRKGKKRPNMREVSVELERIRSSPTDSEIHIEEDDDEEEDQAMSFNNDETWDDIMTAPASMLNNNASSSSDVEPLVARRTL